MSQQQMSYQPEDLPKIMKRDGSVAPFDRSKIEKAVLKCFMDPKVLGATAAQSSTTLRTCSIITDAVIGQIRLLQTPAVGIETIQDLVEGALMTGGHRVAAREYVKFRDARAEQRAQKAAGELPLKATIRIKRGDRLDPLDERKLLALVNEACAGLDGVDPAVVVQATVKNLHDECTQKIVDEALLLAARTGIERNPDYTYVAARLLLDSARREALKLVGIIDPGSHAGMYKLYPALLEKGLALGIEMGLVNPVLLDGTFDLQVLGNALQADRDFKFDYLGLATLHDRYFLHKDKVRFELPQTMYMRVAMGLAIQEQDPTARAVEFYNLLSSHDAQTSTPTLFNSGLVRSQLSSCYLTQVPDDLDGIFSAIHDNAMLSKFAGGLGNDWTPVRGLGGYIKGTNGKSNGVVPFLKVANDTCVAVNQGGKRKGAMCAYLETWHRDIEEFLDLRKNTGDDRRRCHDIDTANWIPDLFMERMIEGGEWTLFSPDDVPDLHEKYGVAFREAYLGYEEKAKRGEIRNFKVLAAGDLWKKMISMLFETGHPWFTFKDPCNLRSPQQHVGVVHSSNLCTEITLNTKAREEIAVCNLLSINLPAHMTPDGLDMEKLERTVTTAMRMLDNVIGINYYSVEAARTSNFRHRPVGLGIMGFHDALYIQRLPYASPGAVFFADESMEAISYFAIKASAALARERGAYESFQGSLWSKGVLPVDSIKLLRDSRKEGQLDQDGWSRLNLPWDSLREEVKGGMRNSNCMAIAPTATISNIVGVSQSIDPTYQNLYVKSNLGGDFTVVNQYLYRDLKKLGLWDDAMVIDLKVGDGSVQKIERVPAELKALYATAFEIEAKWLIDAGSRRQKWIDQAQSLNLYVRAPNGRALSEMYIHAWKSGLKTTYYLRSMGATHVEKTTVSDHRLNAVSNAAAPEPASVPKVCSILDPSCESCQ